MNKHFSILSQRPHSHTVVITLFVIKHKSKLFALWSEFSIFVKIVLKIRIESEKRKTFGWQKAWLQRIQYQNELCTRFYYLLTHSISTKKMREFSHQRRVKSLMSTPVCIRNTLRWIIPHRWWYERSCTSTHYDLAYLS